MYLVYTLFLALGLLFSLPVLLLGSRRSGRYTRFWRERFGGYSYRLPPGAIWIHAVSVGETLAVERLVSVLRDEIPGLPLVFSVTTAAARAVASERIRADQVFYFPLDLPFAVSRALDVVRPSLIVIVETEIWPNFLRLARRRDARVIFVNGRISARSYRRYRLARAFMRRALVCVERFLMQTEADAARIIEVGAPSERVEVAGNVKYDFVPPDRPALLNLLAARFDQAGIEQVLIAGSTMEGEEEQVIAAFRQVCAEYPRTLLLLAPRHPQRFSAVEALIKQTKIPVTRRSQLEALTEGLDSPLHAGGVLLLDSVGELAAVYKIADLAFVGGSLVPTGGHNILEPAYFGTPITFGPYMHNFADMAAQFTSAGAALQVNNSDDLAAVWLKLLANPELRQQAGEAARTLLESQRGATVRTVELIRRMVTVNSMRERRTAGT